MPTVSFSERLRAHLAIARLDHSIKNLFVLPGVIVPLSVDHSLWNSSLISKLIVAFISITLVACSNYVINEVLDAPFDRLHPIKKNRPAARGLVNVPLAYVQWLLMMIVGVALGWWYLGKMFALTAVVLWIMGCFYNFPPVRTKDVPYLDVLTESVNNPLRMLLGWYAITVLVPPVSLLIAYWMIGCYFMALKRFSELNEIGDRTLAGNYRASFKHYTPESLLVSVSFYASTAMLFLGAFIIRYRIELILGFPFIAFTMAIYLKLAFKTESAVQNPEKLYKEPLLMGSFLATVLVMSILLFVQMPRLEEFFLPTLPHPVVPAALPVLPVPPSAQ
ncbi:MAG: UbiA prenyltransferase family protein [Acidobacteriaceae bacterium]|nr:UbiA prenyltransferase family protein [Acidobacteriaceae bacterium]